jgi:hypothetical protein
MNEACVRKIDVLDLIMFNFRHYRMIILIAFIGMILSGGYRLNEFRIALNHQAYVDGVNTSSLEKKRAACLLYVNGREYSNSATERIVDVCSIVVSAAFKEAGIPVEYKNSANMIYVTAVANNMVEVCMDITLFPEITMEQAYQALETIISMSREKTAAFAGEDYLTVMEEPHEGAFYLEKQLSENASDEELDKISEAISVAKYCILGIAAGVVVAVFFATVCYLLIPVLRTEEDISKGFGAVVIGRMTGKNPEDMKKARIVLGQDGPHTAINLISITDKEDRDAAADYLAQAFCVNGHTAVLVYADIRSAITAKKGMQEYILGKCAVEEILGHAQPYDVVECDGVQEGIDLFSHQGFEKLILELKKRYDYVIISSPAYSAHADGVLISSVCDRTVIIARKSFVNEDAAAELKKNLQANKISSTGIIVTK